MTWVLYEGDCLEIMPTLSDKSIDMILCDLPYGTTACSWDAIIPFEPLWEQYERIIKDNGAIVLTASQPFASALVMSKPELFKYEWVWDKVKPSTGLHAKHQPLRQHESVLIFSKRKTTYNPIMTKANDRKETITSSNGEAFGGATVTREHDNKGKSYPRSILTISNANQRGKVHPTQKPVALFEYLIKTYTNPGDLILDNCAGSGTTGVAAENLGRNSILIEKDPKYCEIIRKRMANRQTTLFERGADL